MEATVPVPHRSPLIGRDAERAIAWEALIGQSVRLLTLTGPGGVGKTRLALELTIELAPLHADGANFVSLAELRDPEQVLPSIAQALGLNDDGLSPLVERLHMRLAAAEILLTLDNLEQVATAAPDLERLLESCPHVRILATSRMPLQVAGEHVLPVPPLQTPGPTAPLSLAELSKNESVRLLVQVAQSVDPGFALTKANAADVAEICTRLEGLPLAIELAALRLQVLSLATLRERLSRPLAVLTRRDPHLPPRQQTLRATIAWSYDLLDPPGQALFRCLAVFSNGCDAIAVEAVCGSLTNRETETTNALDALGTLLNVGFLRREVVADAPRFIMPETISEYAREQLQVLGEEEAARHRHASYFLSLAAEAMPALLGPDQEAWLKRLQTEHRNLQAALRWSIAHDPELALQLAAALWRFWYARGHIREGCNWLERTLATRAGKKTIARVRALNGLGVLVWAAGDSERALELQDASLSLAREIGDEVGAAVAQGDRILTEFQLHGDADRARRATEELLRQNRALGDQYVEGLALTTLGNIALSQDDLAQAADWFREALAFARRSGDTGSQVLGLFNLAQTVRRMGELDQAAALYREGIVLARRLGAREDLFYMLAAAGGVEVERRQFAHAARLLGAAAAQSDLLGVPLQPLEQAQFDADRAAAQAALPEEVFSEAWNAGRSLTLDAAVREALDALGTCGPMAPSRLLSERELEVLRLLAAGRSDREIAAALYISLGTATTHVKHIRSKLGVHSRGAAIAYAIRHGLV
jgi:predicted ATPase/DNA-binding CsgD family transcriptional regulator